MFSYFQVHTYLGSDSHDKIALANKIAGRQPSKLSTWANTTLQRKHSTATVPVNTAGEPPLTGEQTALKRI